jgi:hypothetical protein
MQASFPDGIPVGRKPKTKCKIMSFLRISICVAMGRKIKNIGQKAENMKSDTWRW